MYPALLEPQAAVVQICNPRRAIISAGLVSPVLEQTCDDEYTSCHRKRLGLEVPPIMPVKKMSNEPQATSVPPVSRQPTTSRFAAE